VCATFSIKISCTHNLCARKIVKERKLEKKTKWGGAPDGGAVAAPNWLLWNKQLDNQSAGVLAFIWDILHTYYYYVWGDVGDTMR
jgi:hypothetical protein